MKFRILLLTVSLLFPFSVFSADRFWFNFEMTYPDGRIERGKTFSHSKSVTWSNGLTKSYLKLACREKKSGKIERLYSTVDYFSGLQINHKIVDHHIELKVFRQTVKPSLEEIRGLPPSECKEMSPIVNSVTENYRFPATDGLDEVRPFGNDMKFRVKLRQLIKRR